MISKFKKEEKGYLFLELITIVSILSVLAVFAIGGLSKVYNKFLVKKHLIKTESIIENAQFISRLNNEVQLTVSSHGLLIRKKNNTRIIRSSTLPKKLTYKLKNASKNVFNFYKTGVQTPFSLSLSSTDYTCKVTISLRGRIKSECF